jgi:hypothetical protein
VSRRAIQKDLIFLKSTIWWIKGVTLSYDESRTYAARKAIQEVAMGFNSDYFPRGFWSII